MPKKIETITSNYLNIYYH